MTFHIPIVKSFCYTWNKNRESIAEYAQNAANFALSLPANLGRVSTVRPLVSPKGWADAGVGIGMGWDSFSWIEKVQKTHHVFYGYWANIPDFQEFIRRIFRIVRHASLPKVRRFEIWDSSNVISPKNDVAVFLELFWVIIQMQSSK